MQMYTKLGASCSLALILLGCYTIGIMSLTGVGAFCVGFCALALF